MLEKIPNELKSLPYWVGHKNKVPINLKTGKAGSSNDPTSWVPFNAAVQRHRMYGCDGLGFVLRPPYIGVDLDHCIEDGEISPFGKEVADKLDSYTEYSPSGTGLHIICKGNLPRSYKTPEIEIYNTGRYFTMTGNSLTGSSSTINHRDVTYLIPEEKQQRYTNEPGWISKSLENLCPGNFHNEFIRIIGKLHQNRWAKEDIYALLAPHAERVGADIVALKERVESISKYPIAETVISSLGQSDETYSMSEFLAINEKVSWIVPGIVSESSLGFVAGLPETGKTWICLDLAIECSKGGGYWLGKFPVSDAKVMYIDQERWKGETKRRFKALVEGKNLKGEQLDGRIFIKSGTTIRLDLQHSYDAFKREIDKIKPKLVIVDSFATFHTKEENNRRDIQEVLERIKLLRNEFGCAFMFIDHEGKSVLSDDESTPNATKLVGSIGKPAAAEYVLTVRKQDEYSSMVYHTKSTLGKAVEPFLTKVEDLNEEKTKISVKAY